ncbi:ATP-binding protein [Allopontixanthobacter sediminis]|uniref:Novel STAND NTPase 1 domain-containing protein n=1 Tax=Allopontixanthobacter sediminis TaxID=1689985 RepID=A0A845AYU3_9SPHN|nr:ATP-binding protein [Allopontixanthobacter sediminis]MXP43096.1 hypothetical protein [Allopontixanthobacter sediminis]
MKSPFKFLDAYTAADAEVFFGRSAETELLYRLLGETDIVLVYGQSGTGKTSLIQCGLANRIRETDWHPLWVRLRDNINASLAQEIGAAAITPIEPGASPVEAIKSLYLDHLRPIYLIFDQFEELFVLGTREEQEAFYSTAAEIIASDVSCKIIVSLREEYLAQLDRFEQIVPNLFNKRLRVEFMSPAQIERVITGTCEAHGIALENGADTARLIVDKLSDSGRTYVQLAYLQVYLDSLYNRVATGAHGGESAVPVVFTDDAIERTGELGDVMSNFLDHRIRDIAAEVQAEHPKVNTASLRQLLEEFVSVEGTKQPTTPDELAQRMPNSGPWVTLALARLQANRVLREVDGRYELAHDALAARIVETRSSERQAMLQVRKIVRDGLASHRQTRSYLQREELAVVSRGLKQVDPVTDQPLLVLDDAEADFVRKSIRKRRRDRLYMAGIGTGVAAILLGLFTFSQASQADAKIAQAAAQAAEKERMAARLQSNESTDNMAYQTYLFLLGNTDPNVQLTRRQLIDYAMAENEMRDNRVATEDGPRSVWKSLNEFTGAYEIGSEEYASVLITELSVEARRALVADPANWDHRIAYKAILLRQFFQPPEGQDRAVIGRRLVNTMRYAENLAMEDFPPGAVTFKQFTPQDFKPVYYDYDIAVLCTMLKMEDIYPQDSCRGIDQLEPEDLPFDMSSAEANPALEDKGTAAGPA